MAKMLAEEDECALEAARGNEKEHQVMNCCLLEMDSTVTNFLLSMCTLYDSNKPTRPCAVFVP